MSIAECGKFWTKAITSKSKDGWHQINVAVKGSHVSGHRKQVARCRQLHIILSLKELDIEFTECSLPHSILLSTMRMQITKLDYHYGPSLEVRGEGSGDTGDFEVYLALPYMAVVRDKTSDTNDDGTTHKLRWQDSIMDQLVQHGIAKWNGDSLTKRRRRLDEEDKGAGFKSYSHIFIPRAKGF